MAVRVSSLKGVGAGRYYVAEVGSYYLAAGEPPGRWFGDAAADLGLVGEIDDEAFVSVVNGVEPSSGVLLGRRFGERSVRGFDVTFSAPKSVSVLAAVADPAVRAEVLASHDAAVEAVLGYVQRHAQTRFRVAGEVVSVDAVGIAVGVFRQHVSRELDPQLHTHAVIASKVLAPDGRWLALDARALMADQTVLSSLYHAGLRAELTARLGVEWEPPTHGIAEIAGVDERVLAEFSQRSAHVDRRREAKLDRFREALGREPTGRERWRLEREAVKDSRRSKPAPVAAAELRGEWLDRLDHLGVTEQRLVGEVVGRVVEPDRVLDLDGWGEIAGRALGELTDRRSTWRHPDVVRELARAVPTTIGLPAEHVVAALEAGATDFAQEWLVELARPVADGVRVRESDGRPVSESPLERRYTTGWILEQEAELAGWALRRWDAPGAPAQLGEVVGLDLAQLAAAEAVAGTQPLVVIVGPAGTGKTTALRPAVAELRRQNRPVFGVAPTATAAGVLGRETMMAADTIDKLLLEHRRASGPSSGFRLPAGATLIVDEAAMVSTATLAELAGVADRRGWRVVLVGDPLQFLPVGRGGMFDWLVEHGPAVELDRVHRFEQPWERDASLRLRRGDPDALAPYELHGRLHRNVPGEVDFDVLDHWWRLRQQGASVAVLSASNDTVHRLNVLAQQRRVETGDLNQHGHSVLTGAGYRLWVGDEISTRQNDRRLRTDRGEMVRNRDHWTITHIHPRSGDVTAVGPSGLVRLPGDYVAEHVELAYAQTGHAAQGRTVDYSLSLVDRDVDNRAVYVPITRGRQENHVYVALEADDPRSPRDVLAEAVSRDWADVPAIAVRQELAEQARREHAARAVDQPPLTDYALRHAVNELRRIDHLDVPFHRKELARDLTHAHAAARDHQAAVDRLAELKTERERVAARLGEINPWNPFTNRERAQLEADNRQLNRDISSARGQVERTAANLQEKNTTVERRVARLEAAVPQHERRPGLLAALERDLNARVRLAASREPPAWAINALGRRPDRPDRAAVWDQAVGAIDRYRAANRVTDPDRALGPRTLGYDPGRSHATAIIRHANQQLGREQHRAQEHVMRISR